MRSGFDVPVPHLLCRLLKRFEGLPIVATVQRSFEYFLELLHPVGPVRDGDLADCLGTALAHGLVVVQPALRAGELRGRGVICPDVSRRHSNGELVRDKIRNLGIGAVASQMLDNAPFYGIR